MKILLVQTSFLGDTILSTPVIAGIKQCYPQGELWMMTTPLSVQLVERDPLVKGVIPFDKHQSAKGLKGLLKMARTLRQHRFDKVYSLHRSFRTSLLLWLTGIPSRTGFKNAGFSWLYHRTCFRNPADHDVWRNLSILSHDIPMDQLEGEMRLFAPTAESLGTELKAQLPSSYAVMVPGSARVTKQWHWQGFKEVARFLNTSGKPVVLLGAPADQAVNQKVAQGLDVLDVAGKTNISEAMFIVKNADMVICNDSMSLHMASAFKIPTVTIFCATSPSFGFTPWRNKAVILTHELDCRPCTRHGEDKCPTGTEACMHNPTAGEVIEAVKSFLEPKASR